MHFIFSYLCKNKQKQTPFNIDLPTVRMMFPNQTCLSYINTTSATGVEFLTPA